MVWLICVLSVILPLAQHPDRASLHKVNVISSKLTIHGKTNVNSLVENTVKQCQLEIRYLPEYYQVPKMKNPRPPYLA